jgi:hypothetical protein
MAGLGAKPKWGSDQPQDRFARNQDVAPGPTFGPEVAERRRTAFGRAQRKSRLSSPIVLDPTRNSAYAAFGRVRLSFRAGCSGPASFKAQPDARVSD